MEQKQTVEEANKLDEVLKFIYDTKIRQTTLDRHDIETVHLPSLIHKINELRVASLPTNSMQWVRASELKELPKVKKYYNCKYHGMPTVLYIDGKNIVLDGTKLGKGIYDKIEILIESAPTEPTPDNSHK